MECKYKPFKLHVSTHVKKLSNFFKLNDIFIYMQCKYKPFKILGYTIFLRRCK